MKFMLLNSLKHAFYLEWSRRVSQPIKYFIIYISMLAVMLKTKIYVAVIIN